jgi:hypothetical protein
MRKNLVANNTKQINNPLVVSHKECFNLLLEAKRTVWKK